MLRFLMPSRRPAGPGPTLPAALEARARTEDDPHAAYRCDAPAQVQALLRSLRDRAVRLTLIDAQGIRVTATLGALDDLAGRMTFDFDPVEAQRAQTVAAGARPLTVVGHLDAIRVQFELAAGGTLRAASLETPWPAAVYRFQRRDSYRVQPLPIRETPVLTLSHPLLGDRDRSMRIVDLSAGGCALLWPHGLPLLPLGTRVRNARLALDPPRGFGVGVTLQHALAEPHHDGQQRVGCAFDGVDPQLELMLQRWLDATQRDRRLLPQG